MDKDKYLLELNKIMKESGESIKDINACINYATKLIDLSLPVIFDKQHFALLVGIEYLELIKVMNLLEENYYSIVEIPKKSGGIRVIKIPAMNLKVIQRWILDNILFYIPVSSYATGFCKKRSIVNNAERHIGKQCIINLDIENFFPTICIEQIFRIFYYYGYTKEISYLLARLCTNDGYLPQGSPASPYISNIVCLKLDKRLSSLAKKYRCDYSRYADDITFSGEYGIEKIIDISKDIIIDEGFSVNERKTRIAYKHQRQEVTGLIVSENKVSVPKKYKRKLKQEIYFCKKFGVENHLHHISCKKRFYKEHLYGKAYFVHMVEPDEGHKLLAELNSIDWDY